MKILLNWLGQKLERIESREFQVSGKWFLLSLLLGLFVGLIAIVFDHVTLLLSAVMLNGVAGIDLGSALGAFNPFNDWFDSSTQVNPWTFVGVITFGGFLTGLLLQRFSPENPGAGTGPAIDAFHQKRGFLHWRNVWVKTLASAITIGTGGSAGREGPIAQVGAAVGSWLGMRMHLTRRDRRILLAAGMGAGVGAIFRAPLAGALFAAEILYKEADLESEVIVPAAMSSIVSYGVYSLCLPAEYRYRPLFGEELQFSFLSPVELVPYTLMAVALIVVGMGFAVMLHQTRRLVDKIPVPYAARAALGAFLSGSIALSLFYGMNEDRHVLGVIGTGYSTLQSALTGTAPMAISLLMVIVVGKIITTSLTCGSGSAGGIFGPSMVIGGCTGVAVGQFLQPWFPEGLIHDPHAYGVVGMAGFFAGCANAPISTIIMVSELTGEYKLLIPTMWVSTICFLMMRRYSIYAEQVPSRLESPAHRGDFIVDVLEGIRVEEVYQRDCQLKLIPESMPLEQIVHIIDETHQHYFPVVDENGRLVGIFSTDDVRGYLFDKSIWQLANAEDVMTGSPITITPEDNLNTALKHFTSKNLDELPVVSSTNSRVILGMLRRKETISCYNRRLMELKKSYSEDEDSVLRTPDEKP